jgi:hypothetical protein
MQNYKYGVMDATQVSVNFAYLDNGTGRHMEIYCKQWGCRLYNDWNYTTVVYYKFPE